MPKLGVIEMAIEGGHVLRYRLPAKGAAVLAQHTDGQFYDAHYRRQRSNGMHRIEWADGSGKAEVAEVRPIEPTANVVYNLHASHPALHFPSQMK